VIMAVTRTNEAVPAGWIFSTKILLHRNFLRFVSVAIMLVVWEWYGRRVDPIFMSYPTAIAAAIPDLVMGDLKSAILSSMQELVVGLSMAIAFGTVFGLLTGRYRVLDHLTDLQVSALYATPNVALIPLLILWFGLGFDAKVAIIFLAAVFPIIVNTYSGVRNVSRSHIDIARVEGADEFQTFTKIIIPASLPFIMTGIRLSMGRAVVGMVVAEMFTATSGLGAALLVYGNAFATDKVFVVIIVLALFGIGLTESVRLIEKLLAPWKETERAH
jgi:NitT/TauT family transport system permease protein